MNLYFYKFFTCIDRKVFGETLSLERHRRYLTCKKIVSILCSFFLFISCSSLQLTKKKSQNEHSSSFLDDSFFEDEPSEQAKEIIKPQEKDNSEVGYATWYGKELHGKPTASGAMFDMNDYTAAHRDFPIGSQVMVTNIENGKKVMVTVNDRGPYVEGRIMDVSYKTAMDLGFVEKGVTKVKLELVKKGNFSFLSKLDFKEVETEKGKEKEENKSIEILEPVELSDDPTDNNYIFSNGRKPAGYTIQVGAFENKMNAENYRDKIEERFNYRGFVASRGRWHFVWVGDFGSSETAKKIMQNLREEGIDTVYRGKIF